MTCEAWPWKLVGEFFENIKISVHPLFPLIITFYLTNVYHAGVGRWFGLLCVIYILKYLTKPRPEKVIELCATTHHFLVLSLHFILRVLVCGLL